MVSTGYDALRERGPKNVTHKGNHGREVEGRDGSADTKGLTPRVSVHVLGDLNPLLKHGRGDSTSDFDDLKTSKNVSLGINESLTLLKDNGIGNVVHVLSEKSLKPAKRG